jgi:hypothetical protein
MINITLLNVHLILKQCYHQLIENDTEDIINKKLKIIIEHVPVSVSIFSNVPGYNDKPIFFVIIIQNN